MKLIKLLLVCSVTLCNLHSKAVDTDVSHYWDICPGITGQDLSKNQEISQIDDVCWQWIESKRMYYAGKQVNEGGWVNGCMHGNEYENWDTSFKNIGTLISNVLNGKQLLFDSVDWDNDPNAESIRNGMWMQRFIISAVKAIKTKCKDKDLESLRDEILSDFYNNEELASYKNTLHDMHSYIDTLDVFKMITTSMRVSMLMIQMPQYEKKYNEEIKFDVTPIEQGNGKNNCYEASLLQIINALDPTQIDDSGIMQLKDTVDNYKKGKGKLDPRTAFDKDFEKVWVNKDGELKRLITELGRNIGKKEDFDKELKPLILEYGDYINELLPGKGKANAKTPLKTSINLYTEGKSIGVNKIGGTQLFTIQEENSQDEASSDNETEKSNNVKNDIKNQKRLPSGTNKTKSKINAEFTQNNNTHVKNNTRNNIIKFNQKSLQKHRFLQFQKSPKNLKLIKTGKSCQQFLENICGQLEKLVDKSNNTYSTERILDEKQKAVAERIIAIYKIYRMIKSTRQDVLGALFDKIITCFGIYKEKFTDLIDGYYRPDINETWIKIEGSDFGTKEIVPIINCKTDKAQGNINHIFKDFGKESYKQACMSNCAIRKIVDIDSLIDKIFFTAENVWLLFPAVCKGEKLPENDLKKYRSQIKELYIETLIDKLHKGSVINQDAITRLKEVISNLIVQIPIKFEVKRSVSNQKNNKMNSKIKAVYETKNFEYKINAEELFKQIEKIEKQKGNIGEDNIIKRLEKYGFVVLDTESINKKIQRDYISVSIKKYPKIIFKSDENYNDNPKIKELVKNHDYLPVITPDGKILIYRLRGFANYTGSIESGHYNASIYCQNGWRTVDSAYARENYNGKSSSTQYRPVFYVYQQIYSE